MVAGVIRVHKHRWGRNQVQDTYTRAFVVFFGYLKVLAEREQCYVTRNKGGKKGSSVRPLKLTDNISTMRECSIF